MPLQQLERIEQIEDYLASESGTMFALEDHLTYQRELKLGEWFRISVQLLDFDQKRIHYFLRMFRREDDVLAATCEHLSIYVDMKARRSAPFPPTIAAKIGEFRAQQGELPRPTEAGRAMAIRRG